MSATDDGTGGAMSNPRTLNTLPVDHSGDEPASPKPGVFPPVYVHEYRVLGMLGEGAMGQVYLAMDTLLRREVAIKFITRPGAAHTQRFKIEAQAAARVQHPNIASVYRVGEWAGHSYIVSEYVRGDNLGALPKPVSNRRAVELGVAIARGLGAAHRRGVLHRDIKPANIMISEAGEPKLVDFGLAKLVDPGPTEQLDISVPATAEDESEDAERALHDTVAGTILGTPYYMAPELWKGEAATARSDVYSFGALLYELCVGCVPDCRVPLQDLPQVISERETYPVAEAAPDLDRRLAAIIERCLAREPHRRFDSGYAVRQALEQLSWANRTVKVPDGSPYRGLLAFDAEHRSLFFGRENDVRDVVDRLRTESFLLVVGESGVGKSSLVRAGVIPVIEDTGLGDGRSWRALTMVPGTHPMAALVHILGQRLGVDEAALEQQLSSDLMTISRRLRAVQGDSSGTVLFVDQLEEMLGLSEPEQAARACELLACLAERTPGVRVVATVRVDRVATLATLVGIGHLVQRAIYLLHHLDEHAIRDIIVGPARAKGVRFESQALIDSLVTGVAEENSGLPLLQFALSQLWDARDATHGLIRAEALEDIGGVAGALSRHADGVLGKLSASTFSAARAVLVQLVTVRGTRRRYSERDLVRDDPARATALDALVQGRLVSIRQVEGHARYEIAHEALATSWTTLRHWRDEEGGIRLVKERLALASEEWVRVGRARDALWRGQRVREAHGLDTAELAEDEAEFLRLSRRAHRRGRWFERLFVLLPLVALVAGYAAFQWIQHRQIAADVDEQVELAERWLGSARGSNDEFHQARESAFDAFNDSSLQPGVLARGEAHWAHAIVMGKQADTEYARAIRPLEFAYRLDPDRDDVRRKLVEVLHSRALLAQALGHTTLLSDLRRGIELYDDDSEFAGRWRLPRTVTLTTDPAGLSVSLYRHERRADGAYDRTLVQGDENGSNVWRLVEGSYVFVLPSNGETIEVRYPFRVEVGSEPSATGGGFHLDVPMEQEVPSGFVYVAPGTFLFGFGRDAVTEKVRPWYQTLPMHERRTGGFLIARYETTYGEWLRFLRALPEKQRAGRFPSVDNDAVYDDGIVRVRELDGAFELTLGNSVFEQQVREGELIEYAGRSHRMRQDWLMFPVTGISSQDALAYVAWLGRTGQVPGARLCREDEWERGARGADDRMFSHGDRLMPDDANFDKTYGQHLATMGLDVVGSHPASESPFGLHDMIGNAREMTLSVIDGDGRVVLRNGSYFWDEATNSIPNRESLLERQRFPQVGLRVCADWPLAKR